ncbi:hypothetical protein AAT19DRAFT_13158 [Rhodotorula toruloides]|uniref:Uncharacterized protein n=1 Tax=Rhodotorula toruloides TaxID=5286 RepID=A0A2T0ADP2_RHOTO|nr:hypothetical protein AAT19DRAFT_13158 [Rhodotorula toruloides]
MPTGGRALSRLVLAPSSRPLTPSRCRGWIFGPASPFSASYRSNCVRHTLHDVLTTDAARDAQSLHLEPILSLPSLRLPALQPYIPRRPYRHLLDGLATYRAGCFAHLRSFAASPGALAAADGARSRRRRRVSALPPAVANYPFVHAFIITSEAFGSAPLRGLHTINLFVEHMHGYLQRLRS